MTAPTVWDLVVMACMVTLAVTALVQHHAREKAARYADQRARKARSGGAVFAYRDVAAHLRTGRGRWGR